MDSKIFTGRNQAKKTVELKIQDVFHGKEKITQSTELKCQKAEPKVMENHSQEGISLSPNQRTSDMCPGELQKLCEPVIPGDIFFLH